MLHGNWKPQLPGCLCKLIYRGCSENCRNQEYQGLKNQHLKMAFARGYVNSTIRKGDRHTLIFIIIGLVNAKSAVIIYIYDSRFLGTLDSNPCDGGILCLFAPGSNRLRRVECSVGRGSVLSWNTRCGLLWKESVPIRVLNSVGQYFSPLLGKPKTQDKAGI